MSFEYEQVSRRPFDNIRRILDPKDDLLAEPIRHSLHYIMYLCSDLCITLVPRKCDDFGICAL
jgi:hypothetical protein